MLVLLENGTIGECRDLVDVGDEITVSLHDENGNPITDRGIVVEVLED